MEYKKENEMIEKPNEESPLDTELNYNKLQEELKDYMEIKEVNLPLHNFTSLEVALMRLCVEEVMKTHNEPRYEALQASLRGIVAKLNELKCEF